MKISLKSWGSGSLFRQKGDFMEQLSVDIAAQIQWSNWSHCESSFNLVLVPHHPGVYALAEEVMEPEGPAGEQAEGTEWEGAATQVAEPVMKRRKLAIFAINETSNLAYATSSLFALGNPVGEHMTHSRCYVRYAVIEDAQQRHAVHAALQQWLALSVERSAGVGRLSPPPAKHDDLAARNEAVKVRTIMGRPVFPSGF
ncbi:MAG TPA: hypothetical protein VK699_16880 [Terriglobales bacterium]|nr:hypothetical protein [Terriglobales bacterium]